MRALHAVLAFCFLAACTPRAVIPDAERERVRSELDGKVRWLRVAVYAAPFWEDHSKVLLSSAPLADLDLVERPDGTVVPPPPAERVLLPGTALRIREVEFATGWTIAKRVLVTPRYHPWALLELDRDKRTQVLVLSQTAVTFDEIRTELERILATEDPSSLFAALPQEQRDAIGKKELVEGMSPRAVEMAWGLPERRRIDRPAATEEWTWPGGKRRAFFQDERLQRWER
ncbi:MAG TPA: hypothetical protein VF875_13800 [Anaeromyxobacter sp.]